MSKAEQLPVRSAAPPTGPEIEPTLSTPPLPPFDELVGVAARFLAASAIPGLVVYALWDRLSKRLHVSTDIVGFPTWADFNIERYVWRYALIVAFVPLATLALYIALNRLVNGRDTRPRPARQLGPGEGAPRIAPQTAPVVGASRVLLVGGILGLEAAIASARTGLPVPGVWIGVAAVYAVVAALAASVVRTRLRRNSYLDYLAAVNAVAATFVIGGLYAVSATTEVRIASTGVTRHYPWFPIWLAVPATLALVVWVASRLRRIGVAAFGAVERTALVFVVAPVCLFLFVALLPGAGGRIDMFHEGEQLAAGNLTLHGAFPWRDLLFIHGLLFDVFPAMIGRAVFADTRWGWIAASDLILGPLYWVSVYLLCAYLFRRDWLFLAAVQAVIVAGVLDGPMVRFLLLPLVFVLFGCFLAKPTWLRAAAFTGLLMAQVILAPEAAAAAAAAVVMIAAADIFYLRRSHPLGETFRRTAMCLVTSAAFVGLWFVFLAAVGSLSQFLGVYGTFSSHHELTGGVPINATVPHYWFAAITPVAVTLAVFWYLVAKTRLRVALTPEDWTVAAVTLFALVYYDKFLARADHVWESFAVCVPAIFYVGYRITGLAERLPTPWSWLKPRHVATIALACLALTLVAPNSLFEVIGEVPYRFSPAVATAARDDRLGFANADAVDRSLFPDLRRLLGRELGPNDRLFDFTNSPALFYYFLNLPSPTRYYHVSMAIRQPTQRDLIHELERTRPKVVVFTSSSYGLPGWDGITNQVRSYDVSNYILHHYVPWASSHGFMFMRRATSASSSASPRLRDLYFRSPPCDWGYAPDFLTTHPSSSASAGVPVKLTRTGPTFVGGWAVDDSRKRPAAAVVAAEGAQVIARTRPSTPRRDVAAVLHSSAAVRSGFILGIMQAGQRRRFDVSALRIYALFDGDRAAELEYLGGAGWRPTKPRPTILHLGGGRTARVVSGLLPGTVEWSRYLTTPLLRLHLPAATRANDYGWLEVTARTRFGRDSITLGDDPTALTRTIRFDTLPGERKVFLQVGACSQWYGLPLDRLLLAATAPQEIGSIRLIR